MGFLDKLKGTASMAKQKAAGAVDQRGPQIKQGIGKAGEALDKKTKGKYSDKIAKGTSKATEALDKQKRAGDTTPGAGSPTSSATQPHSTTQPPATTQAVPPPEPVEERPTSTNLPPSGPGSTL